MVEFDRGTRFPSVGIEQKREFHILFHLTVPPVPDAKRDRNPGGDAAINIGNFPKFPPASRPKPATVPRPLRFRNSRRRSDSRRHPATGPGPISLRNRSAAAPFFRTHPTVRTSGQPLFGPFGTADNETTKQRTTGIRSPSDTATRHSTHGTKGDMEKKGTIRDAPRVPPTSPVTGKTSPAPHETGRTKQA